MNKSLRYAVFFSCLGTFLTAQNVGIGTSNPLSKLHVAGTIRSDTLIGAGVRSLFAAPNGRIYDSLVVPAALSWEINGNSNITATHFLGTTNANFVAFRTANVERMRILASGNIGIGTTAPSVLFSNSALHPGDQSGLGTQVARGMDWNANALGYAVSFYNSGTIAGSSGALIKTDDVTAGSKVLTVNSGAIGAGTDLLTVLGNGNTGVGTNAPANRLEVKSAAANTSGLRFTNLTAASPTVAANGKALSVDVNGDVVLMPSAADAWKLLGNAGTVAGTNFLGTTDAQDLVFKTNNLERSRILSTGNFGINTINPLERLHVNGNILANDGVYAQNSFSVGYSAATVISDIFQPWTDNGIKIYDGNSASHIHIEALSYGAIQAYGTGGSLKPALENTAYSALALQDKGGNVGIGITTPNNKLEINSTLANASGLRFTNLTSASPTIAAIGKALSVNATGDVVLVPSAADAWSLTGNAGTTPATNFLGTTDAQSLVLRTNNTEAVRILTNGNVGIATTTPGAKLDVGDLASNTLKSVLARLPEGNNILEGTYLGVKSYDTQPTIITSFAIEHKFYGVLNSAINFVRGGSQNDGFMTFATSNNTERMRLTFAGDLGINTLTPASKLDVASATNPTIHGTRNFNGVANSEAGFIGGIDAGYANTGVYFVQKDNTSLGSYGTNLISVVSNGTPKVVVNGTGNMRIGAQFFNSQSGAVPTSPDVSNVKLAVIGGYSSFGSYNSDPAILPSPPDRSWVGGVGSLVLGMNRSAGTSNVDFWNVTDPGNGAAAITASDRGYNWRNFNFVSGSSVENLLMTLNGLGNLTISGTNYFTSDRRLKTNIKAFDDQMLSRIMKLKPSTYQKHASGYDAAGNVIVHSADEPINDFGFIAQDVYEVFPELVSKPKNEAKELWSVDYARLSVMLTKAIQEQQQVIESQDQRIQKLEKALTELLEKK